MRSPRSRSRLAGLALVAAVLVPAAGAGAQSDPGTGDPTTTTAPSTTTTSTTAAPTTAPPTTAPPTTSAPTTAPPPTQRAPEPVDAIDEDGADAPPPTRPIPRRASPRPVTPVDRAVTAAVGAEVRRAKTMADEAVKASRAADQRLAEVEGRQADLQRRYDALEATDAVAAQDLQRHREAMRNRALGIYMSGPGDPVIPPGTGAYEFGRRRVLLRAMQAADQRNLAAYRAAKAAAGAEVNKLVAQLEKANAEVIAARAAAERAAQHAQMALGGLSTARSSGAIAVNGFVFPVAEPYNFTSSFGAPRMPGTAFFHLHQGNDIFAPYGTPLYACERGVIDRMGTNRLGGIKLWIVGESGTTYYYAHLSAFADGITNGTLVEAGALVGYVGNTGNAITTPPHLHFEIHPGGGPAIDPYPILKAVSDATRTHRAQAQGAPSGQPPLVVAPAASP